MVNNPALPLALGILKADSANSCAGFSLLDLIRECQEAGIFDDLSHEPHEVILFKKNFLAMNALYQAQRILWQEGIGYLHISPLRNYLAPNSTANVSAQTVQSTQLPCNTRDSALADYYLDWQHYDNTNEQAVNTLLNQFWTRCLSPHKITQCCELLALDPALATQRSAKRQFQRMAARYHPDKGGNPHDFIELREAYEYLAGALPA